MKSTKIKKVLSMVTVCILILSFGLFALGSTSDESDNQVVTQAAGDVDSATKTDSNTLGDYSVEIKSCRLAKDYEGKDVVIVTYAFANVSDNDATSFITAIEDNIYQDGVGLNESYFVDDSYNYNSDNSTKEIKKGASLDVEIAYELNDTSTPIEVEVGEWLSWDDKIISKTFELN